MRLSKLLTSLAPPVELHGPDDAVVRGIGYDSRKVAPGDLFVALRGALVDGHDYLAEALRLGAAAILVEGVPAGLDLAGRPAVLVPDTRRALAPLACHFYGRPADELRLVGVTGTNGKTSTTFLVEAMLAAAGRRAGLIGTVEIRYHDVRQRTANTTPESLDLQRTLRAMRSDGIDDVVMEVSSHGVALGRIDGCRFAVGAFTNLTQDHLDFHGSMDAYRAAKADFFRRHLGPDSAAVLNAEDPSAEAMAAAAREAGARVVRVSREGGRGADVVLLDAELSLAGSRAALELAGRRLDIRLPLVGEFNLENLLVAAGAAHALGLPAESIAAGASACTQVPGRVERVPSDLAGAPTVLVDYAHTPDALEKLLRTVRPLARGRLVTLFGCGGDRDRGKRPLMAEAAARWSDRVVLTSDNPRSEDPAGILREVEVGLSALRRVERDELAGAERAFAVVPDRRAAIDLAVRTAAPEDMVVLAGKGHEDYQIVGRERLPFDDRLEARAALARRGPR